MAGLSLLLVIALGMGVEGVAIAPVIANGVNAAIIVWLLCREPEPFCLNLRNIKIEQSELKKILQIGVPAGVQGMVFSFANIFIQSTVNTFGAAAIAGSAAALNYESYCYFIISAFAQSTVAFVSQNYGAGEHQRCRRVVRLCMMLSMGISLVLNLLIVWQSRLCAGIFSTSPEVIDFAARRIHVALMFQWIACSYEISGAALRGLGHSMTPTVITIFGTCVLRLLWVYFVSPIYHSFEVLLIVYPISWLVTGIAMLLTYRAIERRMFATRLRSV